MKRYIKSSELINVRGGRFDFLHSQDGGYSESAIEAALARALEFCGCYLENVDFHDVDYSDYPEYAGEQVSQCTFDFNCTRGYNPNRLEIAIENSIAALDKRTESGEVVSDLDIYDI